MCFGSSEPYSNTIGFLERITSVVVPICWSMAFRVHSTWRKVRPTIRLYHIKPGEENLCVAYHNTSEMELVSRPIEEPKEGEALIRIESNSISPNDFQLWKTRENRETMIPGTCATGIIVKTGSATESEGPREGDRVAIEPGLCCLKCDFCKQGRTNLCPQMVYIGTEQKRGTLAKFITHPIAFCHRIEERVSFSTGSLVARVAGAVHCYERAQVKPDSKVLIFGGGLKGLLSLMTFKQLGVGNVIIAEESNYRLNLAKKLGADYVIKISPKDSPEFPEYLQEILSAISTGRPEITVDTVCSRSSIHTASHMTKIGGKMVMMSFITSPNAGPPMKTFFQEIDCIGSYSYTRESFKKALRMVTEVSSFDKLEYFKVPLLRTIDAFSYARATSRENMFILVKISEDSIHDQKGSQGNEDRKTGFSRKDGERLDKNTTPENEVVNQIVNNLQENKEIESFEEAIQSMGPNQTGPISLEETRSNSTQNKTKEVENLNNKTGRGKTQSETKQASEENKNNTSERKNVNSPEETMSGKSSTPTNNKGTNGEPSKPNSDKAK